MINKEDANILIVDDIEDNRFTLERRLKRDNYKNIYSVDGGQAALDQVKKIDFDLILLDLMMPDISGLDVLKSLKGNPIHRFIPVIMVTASDEIETAAECIKNGADDFITKPFNGTLLKARVDACLEKKRLRDSEELYLGKVESDKKVIVELISKHFPDWRRVLNELQRYSIGGIIDSGILASFSDVAVDDLLKSLKQKNFSEVRKWVVTNLDNDPVVLLRRIYDNLYGSMVPTSIPAAVLIIAKYQYQMAFVADQEINLLAALTEIMVECEFK